MNVDRIMRNMMQSMGMGMPMDSGDTGGHRSTQMNQQMNTTMFPGAYMSMSAGPSPMMSMMLNPFQQMMSMGGQNPDGCFSYSSSSVTSYTTDEHGRPQVYQQSSEVKQGPSGLKETKSAIRDSMTGRQEMAIGHHLYDKARIKKKTKNFYTGEEEQSDILENLEEHEADKFEQNWQNQARAATNSTHNQLQYDPYGRPTSGRTNRPALMCPSGSSDKSSKKKKKPKDSGRD